MLRCVDLSFEYASAASADVEGTSALRGVTLEVSPGARVALLGHNGSGKSTLLACLALMNPAFEGTLEADGVVPVDEQSDWNYRSLVAFIGQDPHNQLVSSAVFDEVAFGPCNLGLPPDQIKRIVQEALDLCELSDFADVEVASLSGGQQQRLALAGAWAMSPRYMLVDEPCSMLDPASKRAVLNVIDRLAARGCGVVHVTHELADVIDYDVLCVMEAGQIVWSGSGPVLLHCDEMLRRSRCLLPVAMAERPNARYGFKRLDTPMLCLEGVSYSYGPNAGVRESALVDASLTVSAGEVVLLAGRTGSGKSTLARVACGLYRPDSGRAELHGIPVEAGQIGYLFQRCEDQLFAATVLEDVMYGPLNSGQSAHDARKSAEEALRFVGLDPIACSNASPLALSGGQMRRVALAGVVASCPAAVILDEPTVGLDADGMADLVQLIAKLSEAGTAVLVISHDVQRLLPHVDSAVLIHEGSTVWSGPSGGFARAAERWGYGAP